MNGVTLPKISDERPNPYPAGSVSRHFYEKFQRKRRLHDFYAQRDFQLQRTDTESIPYAPQSSTNVEEIMKLGQLQLELIQESKAQNAHTIGNASNVGKSRHTIKDNDSVVPEQEQK